MIVAGQAAQCRLLANGQRQVVSLRLPGDFVWPLAQLSSPSSCAVTALTELETVDAQPLVDALAGPAYPSLARAVRVMAHLEHVRLGDQIVRLGRQTATERLVHLTLELHGRLAFSPWDAAMLVAGNARTVIDGGEQHQGRLAAAFPDPERRLDVLQVGQAHGEVPQLVGALGLEADRNGRHSR